MAKKPSGQRVEINPVMVRRKNKPARREWKSARWNRNGRLVGRADEAHVRRAWAIRKALELAKSGDRFFLDGKEITREELEKMADRYDAPSKPVVPEKPVAADEPGETEGENYQLDRSDA